MKKGMFEGGVRKKVVRVRELSKFAIAIKKAREEANLSQEALAEALDCSRTSISMVEAGKLLMRLPKFVELCRILNTTPNKLLGFE